MKMDNKILWMLWNLFLAVIPVGLAYAAAGLTHLMTRRRAPWLWLAVAPVLALWLIFLPNSCYLFTEPRHLLKAVEHDNLWSRARMDADAALRLTLWTIVAVTYVAAGAVTFALSIRPMKQLVGRAGLSLVVWAMPFFWLLSLGVYLGLIVRYNSWDLLTRPSEVLETTAKLADRPLLLTAILLFGIFLWVVYEVNDIWIDGFSLRWRRWTGRTA
jgi:uncharacterized membrane protein